MKWIGSFVVAAVIALSPVASSAGNYGKWTTPSPGKELACNPNAQADVDAIATPKGGDFFELSVTVQNCSDLFRTFTLISNLRLPGGRTASIKGTFLFYPNESLEFLTFVHTDPPGDTSGVAKVSEAGTLWVMTSFGF